MTAERVLALNLMYFVNVLEPNDTLHALHTVISHNVGLKSVVGEGFGVIHHPWAPAHIAQNEDDNGAGPGRFLKTPAGDKP